MLDGLPFKTLVFALLDNIFHDKVCTYALPRYTSFTYLGGTTGTVITLPLCGILLDKYPWEVAALQSSY